MAEEEECKVCKYWRKGIAVSGKHNPDFNSCMVSPKEVTIRSRTQVCRFFESIWLIK